VSYRLPGDVRRFAVALRRIGDYYEVTGGRRIHKRYITFQQQ
jgi:hypothetical protein